MMRIIAGTARRKPLATLEGEDVTRPTSERVKEGLFSAIQFEITGRRVLDFFGGTGQLALEALSRGAKDAVIVDQSLDAAKIIKTNVKSTGFFDVTRVMRLDYSEYLKRATAAGEKFDLVFLDPPYVKDVKDEVLKKVSRAGLLAPGAIVVCESDKDLFRDGETAYDLTVRGIYRYGKTYVTLLVNPETDEAETEAKDE